MKKSLALILTGLLLVTFIPTLIADRKANEPLLDSMKNIRYAKSALTRLDEINAIDKTTLSMSEKRSLRKEVRTIKSDLKELKGGMYVPAGTVAIFLLVPFVLFNFIQ